MPNESSALSHTSKIVSATANCPRLNNFYISLEEYTPYTSPTSADWRRLDKALQLHKKSQLESQGTSFYFSRRPQNTYPGINITWGSYRRSLESDLQKFLPLTCKKAHPVVKYLNHIRYADGEPWIRLNPVRNVCMVCHHMAGRRLTFFAKCRIWLESGHYFGWRQRGAFVSRTIYVSAAQR